MRCLFRLNRITWLCMLALISGLANAAGQHAGGHDADASGSGMIHGEGHAHSAWVEPPDEYGRLSTNIWGDTISTERGRKIYNEQCEVCHGVDGTGRGVISDSLEHKPADLTTHLHSKTGNNDGYLFWRVTEGGAVEPFKSQQSMMPAFKDTLFVSERWDVLTYVHEVFHRGFIEDREKTPMPHQEEMGQQSMPMKHQDETGQPSTANN